MYVLREMFTTMCMYSESFFQPLFTVEDSAEIPLGFTDICAQRVVSLLSEVREWIPISLGSAEGKHIFTQIIVSKFSELRECGSFYLRKGF